MFGINRTYYTATFVATALLWALGLTLLPRTSQAAPQRADTAVTTATVDTVLIHFAPELDLAERDHLVAALNGELVRWIEQIHVAEVRLADQAAQENRSAATAVTLARTRWQALGRSGNAIVEIEPNVMVTGAAFPNDPDLTDLQRSYGLQLTHAEGGWAYTRGSNETIIAVIDTGLQLNHPEFAGRIVPGYDFVNNDSDPSDDNGHGTHTAGIIAAGIDNQIGVAGVCPHCRIMPVKVLNQNNAGTWASVANGLLYAADHNARVINLSLGAVVSSKTLESAISYAQEKGVVIVAAAGNMGIERNFFPAALAGVIAVSATDNQDQRWNLSNYGAYIDVAAPGYAIYSTYNDLSNYYGGYTYMSGTSMASPYVAGLAGLLISQKPTRTALEITHLITASADKVSNQTFDPYFGYGRINIERALAIAADTQWSIVDDVPTSTGISSGAEQLFLPLVLN